MGRYKLFGELDYVSEMNKVNFISQVIYSQKTRLSMNFVPVFIVGPVMKAKIKM